MWPELPGIVRGGSSVYAGYCSVRSMSATIGSDDVDGGGLADVNAAQPCRMPVGHSIDSVVRTATASRSGHALAKRRTRTSDRGSIARTRSATRSRCARTSSGDKSGLVSSFGSSRSSSIADQRSSPTPGTRSPMKRATASSRRHRAAARTVDDAGDTEAAAGEQQRERRATPRRAAAPLRRATT